MTMPRRAILVRCFEGVQELPLLQSSSKLTEAIVCGPKSGVSGTYGAAIGDLSPNIWSGAKCDGSIDYSEW
jgi:hypothetical protein